MGAIHGKLNRRSNNTAHDARKKRNTIAQMRKFRQTTLGHFLWQATVVKNRRGPRQRLVTSKAYQVRYQLPEIFRFFLQNKQRKISYSHREDTTLELQVLLHLKDNKVLE